MTVGEWVAFAPVFLVMALAQLIAGLYGPAPGMLAAIVIGGAAALAPRYVRAGVERWPVLVALSACSSAIGILLPMFAPDRPQWGMLPLPLMAGAVTCILALARRGSASPCGSCGSPIRDTAFECPRCGLSVCERRCWNFQTSRCRACEENHVPVFSADPAWWERNFGRRVPKGRCQLCLAGAQEADLRDCQQCGRSYCRDCWDTANGQCVHCLWVVRELPARVQRYVLRYDPATPAGRRTQRVPRSAE